MRAIDIHNTCFLPRPLPTLLVLPQPSFTKEWVAFREDLFRYTQHRRALLKTESLCDDIRYQLLNSHSSPSKDTVKLSRLQEASTECRTRLSGTRLEGVVIGFIDHLIKKFEKDFKPISNIWAQNDLSNPGRQTTDLIRERYATVPGNTGNDSEDFLEDRVRWTSLTLPQVGFPERHASIRDDMALNGSLETLDSSLIKRAMLVFDQVDEAQFSQRLGQILSIKSRLASIVERVGCSNKGNGHRQPHPGTYERVDSMRIPQMELLHDNLFHASELLRVIKDDFIANGKIPEVEQIWLRLMGIIAICWGCTSEHALFFSTMDRLLDQLRFRVGKFTCKSATRSH
jgi:hypothetical protein